MAGNEKLSMDPQPIASTGRGMTQLRLRALEPRRRKRFTAADEVRAFLFLVMLLLVFAISALSRAADPVGSIVRFLQPIVPFAL